MNSIIVDNHTTLLHKLRELVQPSEILDYSELQGASFDDADLIVLSGGGDFQISGNEDKLSSEIDVIRTSSMPIIGICYGAELIATAFGAELEKMDREEKGSVRVDVIEAHPVFGGRDHFDVYEHHVWSLQELPDEFEVLAKTRHAIAVFRHKERPLWGLQFHPEHFVESMYGDEVFRGILAEFSLD